MELLTNTVIEWRNNNGDVKGMPCLDRVLWLDSCGTTVVTIELTERIGEAKDRCGQALPRWRKRTDVEDALIAGDARLLQQDPYEQFLNPPEGFIVKHCAKRDRCWGIIEPLVTNERILDARQRGRLVTEAAAQAGCTKKEIYKWLRRFWQYGQTPNALLPHYHNCGVVEHKEKGGAKRGRPSKLSHVLGETLGVNITPERRDLLVQGAKRFYEKDCLPFTHAYQRTLEVYFNAGYDFRNGVFVPRLPPAEELPSLRQFKYWYRKSRDQVASAIAREGERDYALRRRPLLGDSTQMAFGPGSIYQIDATVGDIYLVSSLDRSRIIGRPVIYVAIDVFSRLIVGIAVTLEGPSWLGAMLALQNAFDNKGPFCKEFGIDITEDEWPAFGLPDRLLADRGEIEGYNADNLVQGLNIRVDNTAPYRADWKAIVEQNFRLLKDRIRWVPGVVYGCKMRGGPDYRLDATLTLNEFRQLMIECVRHHNLYHRMTWYRKNEFMIADHVEPTPIKLWQWGIQNRVGHVRTFPRDVVYANLLPRAQATVTHFGIKFEGLCYTCDIAEREHWFVRARQHRFKVNVAYDPRSLDVIYLRIDDRRDLVKCNLLSKDTRFLGRDWYEVVDYFAIEALAEQAGATDKQAHEAEYHATLNHIVSRAVEEKIQSKSGLSKTQKVRDIRVNREVEKALERRRGAVSPEVLPDDGVDCSRIIPFAPPHSREGQRRYVPPVRQTEMLRRLHQEIMEEQADE